MKKGLLIAAAIILVIIIAYFAITLGSAKLRSARALATGHSYIREVFGDYAVAGEHCQGIDTDGDSYVSCDFRLVKNDIERVINLQCPTIGKSLTGSSCKESRLSIPQ